MKKSTKKINKRANDILTFLKRTKEGVYAPIERSSLNFVRIYEETETVEVNEEDYYYSIS